MIGTQDILRDSEADIAKFDVAYLMVSLDDPEKNLEFAKYRAAVGGAWVSLT